LQRAVELARDRFGGLDAAVAAAGAIGGGSTLWETSDATWAAMVGINLEGVWRLARAAVPALLLREPPRRGRFVAVASAAGLVGMPLLGAYAAAKHGVVGLVRALATELGPEGITANVVCPGSTRGPMLDASAGLYGLGGPDELAHHHVSGELLDPDDVAAVLAWLCSEDARAMTGAVVAADAGLTAR
ncbi:MAG: mycofactocin-coupled SDR family oxidoreductase, partial [Acidimicrobiales bacterium]